eukprot:UN24803
MLSIENITRIKIVQHGDSYSSEYLGGLTAERTEKYKKWKYSNIRNVDSIVVCHSEPGAWAVPESHWPTSICPTEDAKFKVGRTMFETDRIPNGWEGRLNQMDQIWVPTNFIKNIFVEGGVEKHKIRIVPEPINTDLHKPLNSDGKKGSELTYFKSNNCFKFLSIFKFEERKGWKF